MAGEKKRKDASLSPPRSTTQKRARRNLSNGDKPNTSSPAEWNFRLKVVSAKGIDKDLFEEAVNDLVEMCFPETVLDEIGIDVITEHMRQESAPETNVEEMQKVFQFVMVKKFSRMLAMYLDDQAKFDMAITTLKTEVQGLHEYFASYNLASEMGDEGEDDQTARQTSPMDKDQHLRNPDAQEHRLETKSAYTSEKSNVTQKKVSKSQRWDVDPDHLTVESVPNHFRKPSDLYAYHALPIVTRDLGNNATMEKKRQAMEYRMTVMPREEWKQWEDRYKQLRDGELTMLDRVTNDVSSDITNHHFTPAPTSLECHHKDKDTANHEEAASTCSQKSTRTEEALSAPPVNFEHYNMKLESSINLEPVGIPIDTMHPERRRNLEASAASNLPTLQGYQVASEPHPKTPLVDLLWGPAQLTVLDFAGCTDKILSQLTKRVTAKSIKTRTSNGRPIQMSKKELTNVLKSIIAEVRHGDLKRRQLVEHCLEPWVADHLRMFPEVSNTSFFFCHFMPNMTPVLDLIVGKPNSRATAHPSRNLINSKLKELKIPSNFSCGRPVMNLGAHIDRINSDSTLSRRGKRIHLEKYLREVAFFHREKFPELSTSQMVKDWEHVAATRFI